MMTTMSMSPDRCEACGGTRYVEPVGGGEASDLLRRACTSCGRESFVGHARRYRPPPMGGATDAVDVGGRLVPVYACLEPEVAGILIAELAGTRATAIVGARGLTPGGKVTRWAVWYRGRKLGQYWETLEGAVAALTAVMGGHDAGH